MAEPVAKPARQIPDDDPLLHRERAEGRAEGRAEERVDIVRSAVRDAFAARALAITPALRTWLDEVDKAPDAAAIISLAWECRDADDFLRRARFLTDIRDA